MVSENVGVFTGIVGETSDERLSLSKVLRVDPHLGGEGSIVVVIRLVDSSAREPLSRKTMSGSCVTRKFPQTAMCGCDKVGRLACAHGDTARVLVIKYLPLTAF